jgi:leucyl aminopeptidase (aminopeptidase T)
MSFARPFLAAVILLTTTPGAVMAQADAVSWRDVAAKIVSRMALVRGERVLLVGVAGSEDALVPLLREAVRNAGGVDLGAVSERGRTPDAWATDFTRQVDATAAPARAQLLRTGDAAVMMPGAEAADPTYAAMQRVLRSGHGRTVHFHWAGAYDLSGVLQSTTPAIAHFYQRALLETDYSALASRQRAFEAAMRGKVVRVTTPAGTDLRFRIGDRPVTKQDGDASAARAAAARNLIDREVELPAGAIRVAPMEESVEGTIAFPPTVWGGTRVEGLVLTFAAGRVTNVRAASGKEAVEQELAAGRDAARSFRELALGFNPLLAIPRDEPRWIPYYGYGAGVVRLSLGDNSELGGAVGGGYVRWNFFTDATVIVGSDTWVRDGKLLK